MQFDIVLSNKYLSILGLIMLPYYILIYISSFAPAYIIWIDFLQKRARPDLKICAIKPFSLKVA